MLRSKTLRHWALAGLGVCGLAVVVVGYRFTEQNKAPSPTSSQGVSDAERQYAAQRADLCGAGNAVGGGLRGEYFPAPDFAGPPSLSRVDKLIDFDASFDAASESQQPKPRSVRWTGWVKPPLTGRYRFHADAPGVSVSVARTLVAGPGADKDASVEMAIGRFYPITVEVRAVDPNFNGRWRLEWTAPHGMRYVVPTALLFLPNNPGS